MPIPVLSRSEKILLALIAGDTPSPSNGTIWYNAITGKFRAQEGGVIKDLFGVGSGDVVGPASSVDNALTLFNGATGKIIKNSGITILPTNGEMTVTPDATIPNDPGAGKHVKRVVTQAGRARFGMRPFGEPWMAAQRLLASTAIALWAPAGNSGTTPAVIGMLAPTTLGTTTARNVATTNRATRQRRLGYVSIATAGNFAGHYITQAQYTIGDGAGNGGFEYRVRFVPSDAATVAGARMFVGLRNAITAPTNVEPSTLINCVGVAQLSTSGNLHIVYGGSTAQSAIDLGANFPANGLSTDLYDVTVYSPPGAANTLWIRTVRVGTAFVDDRQLSGATPGVTIPAATTLLAHAVWRCNNATAAAVGVDVCGVYIEQLDAA